MKLTYNFDIAYGDVYDSLGESLEALAKHCPSAWLRVESYRGSGGGWPEVTVIIDELDAPGIHEWYGGDEAPEPEF